MFVKTLSRSVDFYTQLLQATVTARDTSAALLVSPGDYQLYLRELGSWAEHPLGAIGIQYLIWSADTLEDLRRCETLLRELSPHVTAQTVDGFDIVERPGPDGVPIVIEHPGPDQIPRDQIIPRIYAW
ncbi:MULTISPECIES: VOC family protein [Subtercola]|nr:MULTISPECIES: VOC family protein [Subtercola]MEA9984901.1 VOC family protein [Subtercola sp. RTI3]